MGSAQKGDDVVFVITGDQLRRWREAVGMSQHDLAKRVYYSANVVTGWESGRHRIPPRLYDELLIALRRAAHDHFEQLEAMARDWTEMRIGLW